MVKRNNAFLVISYRITLYKYGRIFEYIGISSWHFDDLLYHLFTANPVLSEGKDTLPIGAGQYHGYLCDIVPEGPHALSSRKNFQ